MKIKHFLTIALIGLFIADLSAQTPQQLRDTINYRFRTRPMDKSFGTADLRAATLPIVNVIEANKINGEATYAKKTALSDTTLTLKSLINQKAVQSVSTAVATSRDYTDSFFPIAADVTKANVTDLAAIRAKAKADSMILANSINYEYLERMRQDSILNANKLTKSDTSKYVRYGANANGKTLTLGNYVNGYGYKMDMTNGNIAANQSGNNALFQSNLNSLDVANYAASGSNSYRVSISASNPETGNMFPALKLKYDNETALVAHVSDSSKLFVYDEIAQSSKYGNALFSYEGDWYEQKIDGTKNKITKQPNLSFTETFLLENNMGNYTQKFSIFFQGVSSTDAVIANPVDVDMDGNWVIQAVSVTDGAISLRIRYIGDLSSNVTHTQPFRFTVIKN